jgi:hypothetical protein
VFFRVSWLVDWIWRRSSHGYLFALLRYWRESRERERGRKEKVVFRFFRGWVGLGWVGWVESHLEMLICKMPAFLGPEERPMDPSKN